MKRFIHRKASFCILLLLALIFGGVKTGSAGTATNSPVITPMMPSPQILTPAPTVVSTNPADGATSHPINQGITITFSKFMDYNSLIGQIHLKKKIVGGLGVWPLSPGDDLAIQIYPAKPTGYNNEFTIFPAGNIPLADETSYQVIVSDGVKDVFGQKMKATYSFSFKAVIKSFKSVATGGFHSCAVVNQNGKVFCWGKNDSGQLGDGTNQNKSVPTPISSLANVQALSAGDGHTCAVLEDGTVKCWGDNQFGQLGDGTKENRWVPTPVVGLTGAKAVMAGYNHTCALLNDESVKCWGNNFYGALGDGTNQTKSMPTQVLGLGNVSKLAAGTFYTCALIEDGTVRCWGQNWSHQLGGGTQAMESLSPIAVPGLTNVIDLEAGHEHACAILQGGFVKCWGISTSSFNNPTPAWMFGASGNVAQLSAGLDFTCARNDIGLAFCWGSNAVGQLGGGTTEKTSNTVSLSGLTGISVTSVATGESHACALLSGGTVKCWGYNFHGQLGDGTMENKSAPVALKY